MNVNIRYLTRWTKHHFHRRPNSRVYSGIGRSVISSMENRIAIVDHEVSQVEGDIVCTRGKTSGMIELTFIQIFEAQ